MSNTSSDDVSRRHVLAALGALGIAALGAGFGRPNPPGGYTTAPGLSGPFELSLDVVADADRGDGSSTPVATPTPTSTPRPDTTTSSGTRRSRSPGGDRTNGGSTPSGDGTVATVTEVRALADVLPGDEGLVTATLGVSGAPVSVDVHADAFDVTEGGVVEPERGEDDSPGAGELQDFVEVTLWHDRDGDGVPNGDAVVYEGPLAGLAELRDGVPLADCLEPGEHVVRLRWSLPAATRNVVQSDGASFALTFVARACESGSGR